MTSQFDARTKELISHMWGRKVWVVMSKGSGRDLAPHLAEHLDYLIALEAQGKIFASGPMNVPGSGDGMTVLKVDSEAEARAIAEADPLGEEGWTHLHAAPLDGERRPDDRHGVVLPYGGEPRLMPPRKREAVIAPDYFHRQDATNGASV